jgi:hypothetical protein
MKTFKHFLIEQATKGAIAIYPGRFQPMFTHHKQVYNGLVSAFGNNNVYIATSNDTSNPLNSPLNFEQKKKVMTKMLGIKENRILEVASPYRIDLYKDIVSDKNVLYFALGEKDQQERFPFKNPNGINYKKDGITPTAIQPEAAATDPIIRSLPQVAFIKIIPNVESGEGVMSATNFRTAIRNADSFELARSIFFNAYSKPVNTEMDDVIEAIRTTY